MDMIIRKTRKAIIFRRFGQRNVCVYKFTLSCITTQCYSLIVGYQTSQAISEIAVCNDMLVNWQGCVPNKHPHRPDDNCTIYNNHAN